MSSMTGGKWCIQCFTNWLGRLWRYVVTLELYACTVLKEHKFDSQHLQHTNTGGTLHNPEKTTGYSVTYSDAQTSLLLPWTWEHFYIPGNLGTLYLLPSEELADFVTHSACQFLASQMYRQPDVPVGCFLVSVLTPDQHQAVHWFQ